MLVILFICSVFFLSDKNSSQISHQLLEPVFKFCIHPDNGEVCCVRENQDAEIFMLPKERAYSPRFVRPSVTLLSRAYL